MFQTGAFGQNRRFRSSLSRRTPHCLLFNSSFLEQWKNKNQWRCGGAEVSVPYSVRSPGGFLLFIWSADRGVAGWSAVSEQVLELWTRAADAGVQLLPFKQWTRPITISVWELPKTIKTALSRPSSCSVLSLLTKELNTPQVKNIYWLNHFHWLHKLFLFCLS